MTLESSLTQTRGGPSVINILCTLWVAPHTEEAESKRRPTRNNAHAGDLTILGTAVEPLRIFPRGLLRARCSCHPAVAVC